MGVLVAVRVPNEETILCGGLSRLSPVGGWAYGMPDAGEKATSSCTGRLASTSESLNVSR